MADDYQRTLTYYLQNEGGDQLDNLVIDPDDCDELQQIFNLFLADLGKNTVRPSQLYEVFK